MRPGRLLQKAMKSFKEIENEDLNESDIKDNPANVINEDIEVEVRPFFKVTYIFKENYLKNCVIKLLCPKNDHKYLPIRYQFSLRKKIFFVVWTLIKLY